MDVDVIEIKLGNERKKAAENLLQFKKNVHTERMGAPSFLAIVMVTQIAYQHDGVWITPFECLKN